MKYAKIISIINQMPYMAQLTEKPESEIEQELIGVVFRDLGGVDPVRIASLQAYNTTQGTIPPEMYCSEG